ncbi:MAG: tetratricopeptide repeat protein [Planctomycetota bacterium]
MLPRMLVFCLVLAPLTLTAAAQNPPAAPPAQAPPEPTGQQPPAGQQPQFTPEQILRMATQYVDEARKLKEDGRFVEAREKFSQAGQGLARLVEAAPTLIEAQVLLGDVLLEVNSYDEARNVFRNVLKTEPGNFRANLGLGKIYMGNSIWAQAAAYFEAADKVAPPEGRSEAKRLLALTYDKLARVQDAINQAVEAVQADPENLESLHVLVEVRRNAAYKGPQFIIPALLDGEKLIEKCADDIVRRPWNRQALARLKAAYELQNSMQDRGGILQVFYQAHCKRNPRGEVLDELIEGRGPDAAAVLLRLTEIVREQAMLALLLSEHDALAITERAIDERHNPNSVKGLQALAASCQQIQELTARMVGEGVYADTSLREKAVSACQRILDLEPDNEFARNYLQSVGAPLGTPTTAPAQAPAPDAAPSGSTPAQPQAAPSQPAPAPAPPATQPASAAQ